MHCFFVPFSSNEDFHSAYASNVSLNSYINNSSIHILFLKEEHGQQSQHDFRHLFGSMLRSNPFHHCRNQILDTFVIKHKIYFWMSMLTLIKIHVLKNSKCMRLMNYICIITSTTSICSYPVPLYNEMNYTPLYQIKAKPKPFNLAIDAYLKWIALIKEEWIDSRILLIWCAQQAYLVIIVPTLWQNDYSN